MIYSSCSFEVSLWVVQAVLVLCLVYVFSFFSVVYFRFFLYVYVGGAEQENGEGRSEKSLLSNICSCRRSFQNTMTWENSIKAALSRETEDSTFDCQSLGECFLKQLHFGLIQGAVTSTLAGGGYDYAVVDEGNDWISRVILDLVFWLVLTVFMMNIVLGVIVDTFSALRAEQNAREDTLKNNCFICGTHR